MNTIFASNYSFSSPSFSSSDVSDYPCSDCPSAEPCWRQPNQNNCDLKLLLNELQNKKLRLIQKLEYDFLLLKGNKGANIKTGRR